MRYITFALAKGRLAKKAMALLEEIGITCEEMKDEKTRKRELDGLLEAMEYFRQDTAYLITKDEDSVVEMDGKKVYIVPLYKYLIEGGVK